MKFVVQNVVRINEKMSRPELKSWCKETICAKIDPKHTSFRVKFTAKVDD